MEPEYVLVLLFDNSKQNVVMMLKNRGPYPGALNFVGGKVEANEPIWKAAIRETLEETQIRIPRHKMVYMLTLTLYTGVVLHVFYSLLYDGQTFTQVEDEELQWVATTRVLNSVNDRSIAGEGNNAFFTRFALNLMEDANV